VEFTNIDSLLKMKSYLYNRLIKEILIS